MMLSSRYSLLSAGPYLLDEEKLFVLRGGGSGSNNNLGNNTIAKRKIIDVIELSTGFYENSISPFQDFPLDSTESFDGIYKCGTKFLFSYPNGSLLFYDLEKSSTIQSIQPKTKNSPKFQYFCSSRARDGLFFAALPNSPALQAYYVTSTSVTLAPPVRLDTLDKNREYITGLFCHPTKPLIFITFVRGNVQVWNYSNLRKSLVLKSGDDADGDHSHEDNQDAQDDGGGGDEEPSTTTTASKSSSTVSMTPTGVLIPPNEKEKSYVATNISFDPSGRLASVIWTSNHADNFDNLGIYDIRYLPNNSEFKQTVLGSFELTPEHGRFLASTCFHPTEPLLFVTCPKERFHASGASGSSVSQMSSTIYTLSLLEAMVRVISSQVLEYTPISINFPPGSSLFTFSSTSLSQTQIRTYHLSTELTKIARWMTPIVSKLSVPPEAYVEGDGVMYTKPLPNAPGGGAGNSSGVGGGGGGGGWPLVLMIHNELDIFTQGTRSGEVRYLRPMNNFYNLYRIKLNMSSQEKNGATHICTIPSVAQNTPAESTSWIIIPENHLLASAGLFCPTQIKCNEHLLGGVAENGEWMALVPGTSFYAKKIPVGKPRNLSCAPVVCFLKYTPSNSNSPQNCAITFGQFKDAIFYSPSSSSTSSSSSSAASSSSSASNNSTLISTTINSPKSIEILALSEDGTTLKFLSQTGVTSSTFIGPTLLPIPISRLWSSGPNESNVLLYATEPSSLNELQTLYLTSPGMLNFTVDSSIQFTLLPQERVVEVIWQPKNLTTGPQSNLLQARHLYWNESEQMIGVLTSQRVLLLSSELTLLNVYNFNDISNHHSPLNYVDRALSLTWIGRSLIYTLESGAVDYLIPLVKLTFRFQLFIQGITETMGENPSNKISHGRLCTLPTRQSVTSSVQLIACLPDRVLYATTVDITGQFYMSVMARPCLPVEPLILGIIQPHIPKQLSQRELSLSADPFSSANLASKETPLDVLEAYKRSLIESLLTTYIPAKPVPGANTSGGALPMTQATRKLCLALCEAGYTQLVLIAAGVCCNPMEGVGPDFPRNRWISPGMKFHLAVRAGKFAEGCNDLISSRPDLQELFMYPESYGGGTLPHRDSAHSKQFSAAACLLAFIGQYDMARKLADLAGDELLLCQLLHSSQKSNNRKSDIKALQQALRGRSCAYDKILQILTQDGDISPSYEIPVSGIGGADRRTTMLQISSPLSDATFPPPKDVIDLKLIDKAQRQHVANRGGGLGPPTKLGVLAMDSIEDWIGKSRLEVIAADRAHFSSGFNANTAGGPSEENSYLPTGIDKPATWVDDIGTGKEWDKVVGYWRFSDLIRPGEEEFYSSGVPIARINILDLSKFLNPLELFADRNDRIQLQATTSAVDPGEDHTKVKGLNDIVMSSEPYNGNDRLPLAGLRVPIGRGGPLDVGLFHQDPNRCHFTIEMSIFRCENAIHLPVPSSGFCLAKRCCGLSTLDEKHFSNPIWSLSVDSTGALCFKFGSDNKNELKTPPNEVNLGPTGEISVSVWTHVAVVVDTSQSIGSGTSAIVSLFVNGNRSAKGSLHYAAIPEPDLALTTLYFGPNLNGWRFTEVRVWADNRPVIDIEGQRDNYLPLASKRKRMQFRIKGSKKLFGPPPRSLEIGGEPDPNSIPVFNILNQKTLNDDEEKETTQEKTSQSQQKSSGSLLPPGNKSGGLAPPGLLPAKGSLNLNKSPSTISDGSSSTKGGLTPPPLSSTGAATTATSSGVGGLAPPPVKGGLAPPASKGGLAAPPLSSARSRRASVAGVPDRNVEVSSSPASPDTLASTTSTFESETPPPIESKTTVTFATENTSMESTTNLKTTTTPTSLLQPPSNKIIKSRRSSVGSFDPAAISRNLAIARSESTEGKEESSSPLQGFSISAAGVTIGDALRCIRRRLLSGGLPLVITHTAQSIDDQDKIIVIDMPTTSSTQLQFSSHNLSAESAIVAPILPNSADRLVAIYKQKKLSLVSCSRLDPTANTIMGEMPMTLPLIFWSFDGRDRILLMTSTSLFSWDIRPSVIKSSRPQKMIDRIDISDPKRWAERKVLKLNIYPSGWIIVVTCNRVNSENQPVSYAEATASSIVSVFHPSSQRFDQFHGTAACLQFKEEVEMSANTDPFLIIFESTSTGRGDRVYCLDLSYLTPHESTLPTPIKNLSELAQSKDSPCPSWMKWSTPLQMSQVYLGSLPPIAISGSIALTWQSKKSGIESGSMVCILSPFGELFYLHPQTGEVIRSLVISDEYLCSSSFQINTDEGGGGGGGEGEGVMCVLTGNHGRLIRIGL